MNDEEIQQLRVLRAVLNGLSGQARVELNHGLHRSGGMMLGDLVYEIDCITDRAVRGKRTPLIDPAWAEKYCDGKRKFGRET